MSLRYLLSFAILLCACSDRSASNGSASSSSSGPGTTSSASGGASNGGSNGASGGSSASAGNGTSGTGSGGTGGSDGGSQSSGSTVDSEAARCASLPLNKGGTIYYACDCASGADADCHAGNDANSGTDPSTPWRSYDRIQTTFATMSAGDTLAFCKGGSFAGNTNPWVNAKCKADNPCVVRDYDPPWASGDEPLPKLSGAAMNLLNNGNATHEEGYQFLNLDIEGVGTGTGLVVGNDIKDVLFCNLTVRSFEIGMYVANSNPAAPGSDGKNARIAVRGSRLLDNSNMGWLGACTGCVIEYNRFDHNGDATILDHSLFHRCGGRERDPVRDHR